MGRPEFGVAIIIFAGAGGAHHDAPLYEKLDWRVTRETVLECDRLGYDSIWICDHLMMGRDQSIFEGWTTLSALSTVTEKVKLGSWVLCNSYRNPALVAKMAATLDVISGGRLIFGYGAGWHEREYQAYGIPFPKPSIRVKQMKEGLKIIKRLWTEKEGVTYKGKYYGVQGAVCEPKPLQKPHPPIMVGAWKPLMLEAVAELANIWDMGGDPSIETYKEKLAILEEKCSKLSRPFEGLKKSLHGHILIGPTEQRVREIKRRIERGWGGAYGTLRGYAYGQMDRVISGTPDQCVEKLGSFVDVGVSQFIFIFLDFPSLEGIRLLAEKVITQF